MKFEGPVEDCDNDDDEDGTFIQKDEIEDNNNEKESNDGEEANDNEEANDDEEANDKEEADEEVDELEANKILSIS